MPSLLFRPFDTLQAKLVVLVIMAGISGLGVAISWAHATIVWNNHLERSFVAALNLYAQLDRPIFNDPVEVTGFTVSAVTPERVVSTNNAESLKFPNVPAGAQETSLSILLSDTPDLSGARQSLRVFSANPRYSLTKVRPNPGSSNAVRFAEIVRTIVSFCGETILFASTADGDWVRVDGDPVWGCAATPPDYRLPATLIFGILTAILLSWAVDIAARFRALSEILETRARHSRISPIEVDGPAELRRIADAANAFLDGERERLERRADLLSGVSHDLGTPTTRLKLRTALVADIELRHKLEADIEQMTKMIDGVLAYTRNEMDVEQPREVSVHSLVGSIVDDYADTGQPVNLLPLRALEVKIPPSIFASHTEAPKLLMLEKRLLLCFCRPNALRRALTNLIDNALKYGHKAEISIEADGKELTIHIDDDGGSHNDLNLDNLTGPFQRGRNAAGHKGVGLGLTIAESVARLHGGSLEFHPTRAGLRVTLKIQRD